MSLPALAIAHSTVFASGLIAVAQDPAESRTEDDEYLDTSSRCGIGGVGLRIVSSSCYASSWLGGVLFEGRSLNDVGKISRNHWTGEERRSALERLSGDGL